MNSMKKEIIFEKVAEYKLDVNTYNDGVYQYTDKYSYVIFYKIIATTRPKFLWWKETIKMKMVISIPIEKDDFARKALHAHVEKKRIEYIAGLKKDAMEEKVKLPDIKIKYEYY